MNYKIDNDVIIIDDKSEFVISQILECGQVFRFSKLGDFKYEVRVEDKQAIIDENDRGFKIYSSDPNYFVSYFDLDRDYSKIKSELLKDEITLPAIKYGEGIRLLNAPLFETAISFIISANNNIKRIQLILNRLCSSVGENKGGYYAFPTKEKLLNLDVDFWKSIGAGYRANYLPKAISSLVGLQKSDFNDLTTLEARKKLIKISGIGPKVADCILLFGLQRFDVFPVDVWIEKSYHKYFESGLKTREKMSEYLVSRFKDLSGFAQQYIYNYRNFYKN